MKYIFFTIILFALSAGFVSAVTPVNGGPAQLPEQHILQPKPDYTNPNYNGNANFQESLGQDNSPNGSPAPSSLPGLAGQGNTGASQSGTGALPGASQGGSLAWLGFFVLAALVVAAVWRSLNYSNEKK
jgi:hypothetical protein